MKYIAAKEGNWLTWKEERPIGEWEWFVSIYCPDSIDTDATFKEITDAEKVAKEEEQEEWRKEQDQVMEG